MDYGDLQYDLMRCRDLLDDERFESAFELAASLIERASLDPEVVALFADAAVACGEPAAAVHACQRILRAGGRDVEVLEWLLRAQWDLGLTERCRATCREVLDIEPENYTALDYGLGTVLELGDFERAADLIERAAGAHQDNPHLAYQTAVARMMRGEDEWALGEFTRFVAEDPDNPASYINLMRIHHLAGKYGDARAIYEQATARDVEHADLHFNMGLALKAEEREREAVPYFIRAIRAAERADLELPDANLYLGQILRSEGHPRLALWMLERELGIDDTHPAVHAEMAWCEEDMGQFRDAIRMIRAAVERAPDWGLYHHSLAELLLRENPASDEAEAVARQAVALDAEHAAGWQVLGRIAAERADLDVAEESLRRAIRCPDATAEDKGWLGLLLFSSGRADEALPYLELAARVYPFWEPVGEALGQLRGGALPVRYEVRISGAGPGGRPWYRVVHVIARDENGARTAALGSGREPTAERGEVDEVRPIGFEVDHSPGIVWDSGRTGRRYPEPPEPPDSDSD